MGCFPPELWEPYQQSYFAANRRLNSFTLLDHLRRTSVSPILKGRIRIFDELHRMVETNEVVSLPCFVSRLVQGFGLKKGIKRTIDSAHNNSPTHAAYDVEDFTNRWLSQRQQNYDATLQDQLIQFSEMLRENDSKSRAEESVANSLFVGTIHRSKGREFEVVFLLNASADTFGGYPDDSPKNAIDDERRLLYVAASRAKESLYILFTDAYNISTQNSRLSPFLKSALRLACVRRKHFPPIERISSNLSGQGENDSHEMDETFYSEIKNQSVIKLEETIGSSGHIEDIYHTPVKDRSAALSSHVVSQSVVKAKSIEMVESTELSQPKPVFKEILIELTQTEEEFER